MAKVFNEGFDEIFYANKLVEFDNKLRNETIKKLKTFLKKKSSTKGFSHEDFLKIWKGLYYAMYMADKPLVQEDLAEEISTLIHQLSTNPQKVLFFKVALDTLAREWNGIDKFRMDKFLMLITRIVRQTLFFLAKISWSENEVKQVSEHLESCVICPFDITNGKPLGLKMHITDLILEELAKVGKEALPDKALIVILLPFFKVLALANDSLYINAIKNRIIYGIIKQSKLGIKHQEDLTSTEYKVNDDDEEELEGNDDDENFVMDARAGGVDVFLPFIRPDYSKVAEALLSLSSIPEICRRNRDNIVRHANKFIMLAKGRYPLAFSFEAPIPGQKKERDNKAIERLLAFKNGETPNSQKRKLENENDEKPPKKKKLSKDVEKKLKRKERMKLLKRRRKAKLMWTRVSQKHRHDMSKEEVKKALKVKAKNESVLASKFCSLTNEIAGIKSSSLESKKAGSENNKVSSTSKILNNDNSTRENKKQVGKITSPAQKGKTLSQKIKSVNENKTRVLKKKKKRKSLSSLANPENLKLLEPSNKLDQVRSDAKNNDSLKPKASVQKQKNKKLKIKGIKKENTPPSTNEIPQVTVSKSVVKESKSAKRKLKIKKLENEQKDPWKEPLKKGETEFEVTSKKFMKKKKKDSKLLMKKIPKKNARGKTLKINLQRNKEHEFKDYKKVLKKSPAIPFSSLKKPPHSVLKPSPSPNLVRKSCTSRINFLKTKYQL